VGHVEQQTVDNLILSLSLMIIMSWSEDRKGLITVGQCVHIIFIGIKIYILGMSSLIKVYPDFLFCVDEIEN